MWLCYCYCPKIMQFELALTLKIICRVEHSNNIKQNSEFIFLLSNTLMKYARITKHHNQNHATPNYQPTLSAAFQSPWMKLHFVTMCPVPFVVAYTTNYWSSSHPSIQPKSNWCKRALQSLKQLSAFSNRNQQSSDSSVQHSSRARCPRISPSSFSQGKYTWFESKETIKHLKTEEFIKKWNIMKWSEKIIQTWAT
jgi:hypothetical protein